MNYNEVCDMLEEEFYQAFQDTEEIIDFPEDISTSEFDKPEYVAMNGAIYPFGEMEEPPAE